MSTLTKGEEEVMQVVWKLGKATVHDVIECLDEPKPKYTTVATFLKLLEDKKFVGHIQSKKVNTFYPLVDKMDYAGDVAGNMLDNFFDGSLSRMVSFFGSEKKLSPEEKAELLRLAQEIVDGSVENGSEGKALEGKK